MKYFSGIVLALLAFAVTSTGYAKPQNGKVFKKWTVSCEQNRPATKYACSIGQDVLGNDRRSIVAAISVGYSTDKKLPVSLIVLPLGVRVTNGVLIETDNGKFKKTVPFRNCDKVGCYVIMTLEPKFVAAMKNGTNMKVTFGRVGEPPAAVIFSLSGFTAAFNSLN